jgi:hypothetical protein
VTKKRGRKPQDLKWTRVLKFNFNMDEFPPLYSVPRDLNLQKEEQDNYAREEFNSDGNVIYHDGLKNEKEKLSTEDHRLTVSELRLYAEKLMIVRKDIQKRANQIINQESDGPEEAKED